MLEPFLLIITSWNLQLVRYLRCLKLAKRHTINFCLFPDFLKFLNRAGITWKHDFSVSMPCLSRILYRAHTHQVPIHHTAETARHMHQGSRTWDPRRPTAMVVVCVIDIQVRFRDQITKVGHMTTTMPGVINPGIVMDHRATATIEIEDHSEMIGGTPREKYDRWFFCFLLLFLYRNLLSSWGFKNLIATEELNFNIRIPLKSSKVESIGKIFRLG